MVLEPGEVVSRKFPRPRNPLNDFGRIVVKHGSVCLFICLGIPWLVMEGYTVKPKEALVGCVVSPIFMLGIWHGGD